MGVEYVCGHVSTPGYASVRNEKAYTSKHTILYITGIKVWLYMNLPSKAAGQQMLGRDLRMLLSGLEVNGHCWYLFM